MGSPKGTGLSCWQKSARGLVKSDPEATATRPIRPCAECGQPIDPIHRCERCRDHTWCGRHNSPYKTKDARYCGAICKNRQRDRKKREQAAKDQP